MPEAALSTYRPWLDGVRGVAVLLVVASHTTGALLPGMGEAGVGTFFGLSGYLITGLLLSEHARSGTVRLRAFYARRTARLLPQLVLVLVVCNALYVAVGRSDVLPGSVGALFYVANYQTILSGEYLPGYGHMWSLAVEEHFYLVWPVLLLLVLRRRSLSAALRCTLVVCAAAVVWRCVLVLGLGADDLLLYHGTLERADALLYGCAAALAVRLGWRPPAWSAACAAVGLSVVLVVGDAGDVGMTLLQAVTAVASAALVVGLDHRSGLLRRAFALRPLVWVGVMSYGIYLWHYPLIRIADELGAGLVGSAVAGFVLSPALAALSYYGVERHVRVRVRARFGRSDDATVSPADAGDASVEPRIPLPRGAVSEDGDGVARVPAP